MNDDKTDCRLINLAYGTPKQNRADAKSNGRLLSGERHPGAKLSRAKVAVLREARERKVPYRLLGLVLGVDWTTVQSADRRRTWKEDESGNADGNHGGFGLGLEPNHGGLTPLPEQTPPTTPSRRRKKRRRK